MTREEISAIINKRIVKKIVLKALEPVDWITINGTHVGLDETGNLMGEVGAKISGGGASGGGENPNSKYNDLVGVKCGAPMSHEDALAGANPNYGERGSAYKRNCYLCAATYELRRRGFDVEAQPALPSAQDNLVNRHAERGIAFSEEMFVDPDSGRSRRFEDTFIGRDGRPNNINISRAPDGARFLVGVDYKTGGGHSFFAEKVDGEIRYFDPQKPDRSHSQLANLAKKSYGNKFQFIRVDDQEINPNIKVQQAIKPKGGK